MATLLLLGAIYPDLAWAQPPCPPLPPPGGTVLDVTPQQADQLRSLVAGASSGTTVRLADGVYAMDQGDAISRLVFDTPGVTLRSASGNRDAVILDGDYQTNELISIHASDITIASITLRRAYDHPIHISGNPDPISGTLIHDVHILDPGEQAIKINPVGTGWVDDGIIECSHLELTPVGRSQVRNNCYTGGVDAHAARGWWVRRNRIEGFWCTAGLSEHGIHFWQASRDTVIEENLILNCARGIGLGLGENGNDRTYDDNPYPGIGYLGHIDGTVRNNFIAAGDVALFGSQYGFDSGIGLAQARTPLVLHNSVASTVAPFSSIEWRFGNTLAEVTNNLVSHNLRERNGGQANLEGNLDDAPLSWWIDAEAGDLHLASDAVPPVGNAALVPPGAADQDFDAILRPLPTDVGADAWSSLLFADGFESGGTAAWGQ